MPYATREDILTREGEDALFSVGDRNRDDVVDFAAVDRALADASADIDAYLSVRYTLPLSPVPPVLTRLCVHITLYRLALSADALTKELRQRYEDALSMLKQMASGAIGLGLPSTPSSPVESEVKAEILVTSNARLFTRAATPGL